MCQVRHTYSTKWFSQVQVTTNTHHQIGHLLVLANC